MSQVIESLDAARRAGARGVWRDAHAAYSDAQAQVDGDALAPEDLELFSEAAWSTGRLEESLDLRARAYAAYQAGGDHRGAARVALALAASNHNRGAYAVAHGWFAKAERLVASMPEAVEHAQLALARAMDDFMRGDLTEAMVDAELAYELGERFGDRDVQATAQVVKGHALVQVGKVDEGLALLDEATAAAVCGELRPFATGFVYCCTIACCQSVGDYRRAAEWTDAANKWRDELDVVGQPGACRVHRAELMRLRGDWPAAEAQATAACAEIRAYDCFVTAAGHYEVGEIRRRRGDFAAAEAAYGRANEFGRDPQPGLALLRLAEGKVDTAVTAIRRALDDLPQPLTRLQRLPAQVEISIAAGELSTARAAAEEMERIIDAYKIGNLPAPALEAVLNHAKGHIRLAEGEAREASRSLRRARDEWQRIGAPYETAQARIMLGISYRRQGDEDGAMSEFEPALATFERLGAKLDEERARELLGRLETRRTFLFTDIVDSTKLLATLGDEKWRKLLGRHDELLRRRIVEGGGEVIKQTGDGFFASFEHPKEAIEAALAIQRSLDAEVVAPDVRIGVHTGGAFHTDGNPADYGGQGVHVAARVGAAARAGEILVSRETLTGASSAFRIQETREEALKGFEQPVTVESIDWR